MSDHAYNQLSWPVQITPAGLEIDNDISQLETHIAPPAAIGNDYDLYGKDMANATRYFKYTCHM